MTVIIQNVVATANLAQRVDATKFTKYSWGTYDVAYYGGLCGYIKDSAMQGRVTVFFTGKIISVGAKSIRKAILQLEHAKDILVEEGFIKNIKLQPKIQNIVGTMSLSGTLDLNKITTSLKSSTLEPEIFPGVIYKTQYKTSCLIFSSGKIVITGARSESQLRNTEKLLNSSLRKFITV